MKFLDREEMLKNPEIVFCDNHILVVAKPAGMPTQDVDTHDLSLEQYAKQWIKKKYEKPGNVFLHAIHRLDKPVAGLVIFARTSKALSRLQEMQRERQIEKVYLAYVEGILLNKKQDLVHYLYHEEFRSLVVSSSHPEGKKAELHYDVLKENAVFSLLKIVLVTGRYHQIRSQLSAIGHPILGDKKYGSKIPYQGLGIALFHTKVTFLHPVTKEKLTFEISFPDERFIQNLI